MPLPPIAPATSWTMRLITVSDIAFLPGPVSFAAGAETWGLDSAPQGVNSRRDFGRIDAWPCVNSSGCAGRTRCGRCRRGTHTSQAPPFTPGVVLHQESVYA